MRDLHQEEMTGEEDVTSALVMEEETLEETEIVEMTDLGDVVEEVVRETLVVTDAEEVIETLGIGEEVEDLPIVDLEMMIVVLLVMMVQWIGAVDLEDLPVMMTTAVDPKMMNAVDPLVIDQPEIKMTAGRRSTSVKTSQISRVLCARAISARVHLSNGA